ncbi:MAG: sugar phosphate isomerase/epimerase [Clostridia bacterium]|nr:sugar phosphate isomerase/epimerase [Clostridia bacterium]
MKSFKIGVQLYSVRDEASKDFKGTLKALKEMGYEGAELAGTYGLTAKEIRSAAEEAGIDLFSAHVPLDELRSKPEETVALYREIGCRWIAVPYLMPEDRPQSGGFQKTVEDIKKISEVCKANGIKLCYHNHDFEFFKMPDGRYALDYLYESLTPDQLLTEVDTCWVHVAGVDPAAYVRKYAGRAEILHLKDYDGEKSDDMYALIGIKKEPNPNAKPFDFRPVGSGKMPIREVIAAAADAGTEWLIVEQDEPAKGEGRMPSVKQSIDYLKKVLN